MVHITMNTTTNGTSTVRGHRGIAPHQRPVDASEHGDTTPRIINNKEEVMPDPKAGGPVAEPRQG
jgi:hypothetical protein